jgi:tetratricopeptide (TPR) repeat protein
MAHAAVAPAGRWLYGPAPDLLLGAGLLYLPVFALLALEGDAVRRVLPLSLMPLVALGLNFPHLGATLLRVYERREDRQRYALFALHATLVIAAAFVAGLFAPIVGSLLITLYLSVVPWHFAGQNYGIALVFLARRGVEVTPAAKRFLYASFALSFAMTLVGLHGGGIATLTPVDPTGTVYGFLSLGIQRGVDQGMLLLLSAAYLWTLVEAGSRLLARAPARDLAPAAAVVFTQALWFSAPILANLLVTAEEGMGPLAPEHYAYTAQWVALGHAVQYLWITRYYVERQQPGLRAGPFFGKALLAGAAIYGFPMLLLAPGALGSLPYESGLVTMLAGALNLHHVLLDGAIWKLRSGPVARILIRGAAEGAQAAAPARRRLPVALLVWASGAVGVALMLLGTLEFEFGFRRPAARGDLARLETAAQRLAWLGRDDPSLRALIGALRAEAGDRDGALRAFEQSLALHPTANAWVDLGVLREREGALIEALAAYQAALALQPQDVDALHYAGRAELAAGRPERARELLGEAARLAPDRPEIRRSLARARAAGVPATSPEVRRPPAGSPP